MIGREKLNGVNEVQGSTAEVLKRAMRATNSFLLDGMRPHIPGADYVDMALLIATTQANVAHITADRQLNVRFGDLKARPPDDARRPVSINALAASLNLPFETTRRRVRRLAERGLCVLTSTGVLIPAAIMDATQHDHTLTENYKHVRCLYRRLIAWDALGPLEAEAAVAPAEEPIRAVARVSYDHMLRLLAPLLDQFVDLVAALAWMTLLRANTEHLSAGLGDQNDRRPVAVSKVAERLGLPEPNVRRRLQEAVSAGLCSRGPGGLRVSDAALERPEFMELMRRNQVSLARMFAALARIGVLGAWRGP